jgi:hypothetical protein
MRRGQCGDVYEPSAAGRAVATGDLSQLNEDLLELVDGLIEEGNPVFGAIATELERLLPVRSTGDAIAVAASLRRHGLTPDELRRNG